MNACPALYVVVRHWLSAYDLGCRMAYDLM